MKLDEAGKTLGGGYGAGGGLSGGPTLTLFWDETAYNESKGFGIFAGGSIAFGTVGIGIDLITAGEGEEIHPIGVAISYLFGAGWDFHVGAGYTFR